MPKRPRESKSSTERLYELIAGIQYIEKMMGEVQRGLKDRDVRGQNGEIVGIAETGNVPVLK